MPEKNTRGRSRRGTADLIVIAAICAVLSGAVYVAKRFAPLDAPAPVVVDPVAPILPADDVPSVAVDPFDREQVSLAFARNRQLFAQVCLETARRGANGEFKTEADESAFAEPLWQRASKEAFSLLAEAQDRRHGDKWDPTESARQHLEWAAVADPRSIRPAPPDPTNKRRRPLQ